MRVLQWMIGRVEGTARGQETAFGTTPRYSDLNWSGLSFSPAQFEQVTSLDAAAWKAELGLHAELFQQLAYHLPAEMSATKAALEKRFAA
jgi:phosphoenolpyruvate carboxykinase (GTP)